jgi:hypothetical protein
MNRSKRRLLIATDDIDTSIIPDDIIKLFWYHFGYNKANITWSKLKKFIEDYDLQITTEQKLFLHNLQFKTK